MHSAVEELFKNFAPSQDFMRLYRKTLSCLPYSFTTLHLFRDRNIDQTLCSLTFYTPPPPPLGSSNKNLLFGTLLTFLATLSSKLSLPTFRFISFAPPFFSPVRILQHICSFSHLHHSFRMLSFSLLSEPAPFSPQLFPHFCFANVHLRMLPIDTSHLADPHPATSCLTPQCCKPTEQMGLLAE